jgi:hypothetical protein
MGHRTSHVADPKNKVTNEDAREISTEGIVIELRYMGKQLRQNTRQQLRAIKDSFIDLASAGA